MTTQQLSHGSEEVSTLTACFLELNLVLRKAEQQLRKDLGISTAQLSVVELISQRPGTSVNEIAQRLRIHQSSASGLIKSLNIAGYTAIRRGLDDQRRVRLHLTPKGRRLIARTQQAAGWPLRNGIQSLSPSARTDLLRTMRELIGAVSPHNHAAKMTATS